MDYSGRLVPDNAVGYFCVASHRVRHPIQIVTAGNFLIGSGTHCHLRLGEAGVPSVLCVVSASQETAKLECSVTSPAVVVNGSAVTRAELKDGDLLEVGDYRLLFRLLAECTAVTREERRLESSPGSSASVPGDTDVSQLVSRVQQELEFIARNERTAHDGVAEILAAASRAGERSESERSCAASAELSVVEALQHVTEILHRQHEASRVRMESVTEVLNNVVRQQQSVADTLQVLSQRIVSMEASRDFVHRRASA